MENDRHEIETERQCNLYLESKLQMKNTQLENARENSNKLSCALESLENKYAALLAERKASELKAYASEKQLKRYFSEAKRLVEQFKDDLKITCAERDIFERKLADAKQTVFEYRRKEADIGGSPGGTHEDQSSEIDRLKQELKTTRQELDNTNIRYGENSYYL